MPDLDKARADVQGNRLDEAGAEIGLDRATVAGGHGFDEPDDSYDRRLRHWLELEAKAVPAEPAPSSPPPAAVADNPEPEAAPIAETVEASDAPPVVSTDQTT